MMMMMTKAMITFSFPPPTAVLRLETCWNVCHLCVHYNRHIQKIPKKLKQGTISKLPHLEFCDFVQVQVGQVVRNCVLFFIPTK